MFKLKEQTNLLEQIDKSKLKEVIIMTSKTRRQLQAEEHELERKMRDGGVKDLLEKS